MFSKFRIAINIFRTNGFAMSGNGIFASLNIYDSPASVSMVLS